MMRRRATAEGTGMKERGVREGGVGCGIMPKVAYGTNSKIQPPTPSLVGQKSFFGFESIELK